MERELDCECRDTLLPLWSKIIVAGQPSVACYCGYCGKVVSWNRIAKDRRINGDRRLSERRKEVVALVG